VHVVRVGVDDVAEDDVTHVLWRNARSFHGFAHDGRRQVGRWMIFEASAVLSDRRPDRAQHNDFTLGVHPRPSFAYCDRPAPRYTSSPALQTTLRSRATTSPHRGAAP